MHKDTSLKTRNKEFKKGDGSNRKPVKRNLIIACIAALLAVILMVIILSPNSGSQMADIATSTAVRGDITTTVVGSGNLDYGEKTDLLIPTGLKVNRVFTEAGDYVEAGDVIATFDAASVQTQIEKVEENLKSVDRDINNSKGDKVPSYVYSRVSGRVKVIYAETGDETAEVIEQYGALMILSIDGKMAVDFISETELETGDSVKVVLPDGVKKTGTVESAKGSSCTVTLDDYSPEPGDSVTIEKKDGTKAGKGQLYIHQPIAILGNSGKIASVYVSKNSYVYSGTAVIRLEDVSYSGEYQQLLAKREELSATLSSLITISRSNSLVAQFGGVVQSVSIKNDTEIAAGSDYRTVGLIIASGDNMVLSIEIDELDILNVSKGQSATITFDAISGKVYEGTITKISDITVTTSTSARYKVTVEVLRDDSMRAGMNATAVITIGGKTDVVLIPLAAIQEVTGREFVYLSLDEKGVLSEERDVVTGLSDGKMVEIVSGLEAGETVYYNYTSGESTSYGFGGMTMDDRRGMMGSVVANPVIWEVQHEYD